MKQVTLMFAVAVTTTAACGVPDGGRAAKVVPAGTIAKRDLGDSWPLTVEEGILECRRAGEVVFTAKGTTYAVNGLAKANKQYEKIDAIWIPNPIPGFPNAKKNIGPLIDRGLALCE